MVVEENSVKELPFSPSKKLFAVKQEVGFVLFMSLLLLHLQTNKLSYLTSTNVPEQSDWCFLAFCRHREDKRKIRSFSS